jgi:hypothetical protein
LTGAFDQPIRQTQPAAPPTLGAGHFAMVAFMVHAKQVENPVQDEDGELREQIMTVFGGLSLGGGNGDGDVTQVLGPVI